MATEHHTGRLDLTVSVNQTEQETGFDRLGRVAYVAYCESSGGVSLVSGAQLPAWDELGTAIRAAWAMAATAVVTEIVG